jgi:hypothetical protein
MDLSQFKDVNPDIMKNLNNSIPPEQKELFDSINDGMEYIKENQHLFGCDDECKKNMKEEELYKSFINAEVSLNNAPKNLSDAERKFITYKDGGMAYQKIKEKKYSLQANKEAILIEKDFLDKYKVLNDHINMFRDQNIYYENVYDLSDKYKDENKKIENKNKQIMNKNNISNRKLYYDFKWIDFYKNVNWYVKKSFWVIFTIFIFLSIYYKKYTSRLFKIGSPVLFILAVLSTKWIVLNIKDFIMYIYRSIKKMI